MGKVKCLRSDYKEASDDQLDLKATAVKNGLTDHAADFPAPPVTPVQLGDKITVYQNTRSAYKRGGLDQKAAFINAKEDLLEALDENADYVDDIADGEEELITKAGYVPTKAESTPKPVPNRPTGVTAKNANHPGEMIVECPAVDGASYYGLIVTENMPLQNYSFIDGLLGFDNTNSRLGIDVNKGRKKLLQGLQPGTIYFFYMYAGNATGVSGLSDAINLRAL